METMEQLHQQKKENKERLQEIRNALVILQKLLDEHYTDTRNEAYNQLLKEHSGYMKQANEIERKMWRLEMAEAGSR